MRIVVLSSTRGTSMQAILDDSSLPVHIPLVVSDRTNAPVLERAKKYGIKTFAKSVQGVNRKLYDRHLAEIIKEHSPDIVCMIGYMRIVSKCFVDAFKGRVVNMHPSLLPKYAGLQDTQVHQAVLKAGDQKTGCTLHHVIEAVDKGETVLQLECSVEKTDTVETLKRKVQNLEGQGWITGIRNWRGG